MKRVATNHRTPSRKLPASKKNNGKARDFFDRQLELEHPLSTQSQLEAENSRERYLRLFDSAPVASLRLDFAGNILGVNLAGAKLLCGDRRGLVGSAFIGHIAKGDRRNFVLHLRRCFNNYTRASTELQLNKSESGQPVFVELISIPGNLDKTNRPELNSALIDISRRKQAELLVQENEARFRALSENVAEGIILLTAKGRIFYQSSSVQRLLGYTVPELASQPPPPGLIHLDDLPGALRIFEEVLAAENSQRQVELRVRHKNGSWRWLEIIIKNLLHDSSVAGVVLNARDVTEERGVYDALRENEEHLRLAQKVGGIGSFDFDVNTGKVSISETFADIMGLSLRRKKFTLREWELRVHREDRPQVRRHWQRAFSDEEQVAAEYRIVRAHDREVRWVAVGGRVYRDSTGKAQRVVGTLQDISERVESRLILQRSKEQLESLVSARTMELRRREQEMVEFFEQSPVGMLWIEKRGRIIRVNRAQLELIGRSSAEVLGHRIAEFHPAGGQVANLLRRLGRGETVRNYRIRLLHKDGSERHVLVDANGSWRKGKLLYSRWFVRDITMRAELEREILQIAERERQRIGRDLHDDLCQQLTGIEFLSQSLASQLQKTSGHGVDRVREIAQMVRDAITHTRELAHGLSPMRLGLQQTLHELAVRTKKMFGVDCRFRCKKAVLSEDDSVNIHLYRIAQESVSNAIKHGKAKRIDIELSRNGKGLMLGVKDFGTGIPEKLGNQRGMGLRVMNYRASVIGGTLNVERNPHGGTTVICTVGDPVVKGQVT